ncbi:MAG TPA: helical backbone metal receptor, partial [Burkholderiaceae bacterium]|nr:helical backbone metal receptor [Burkholderiaceae bacterium]
MDLHRRLTRALAVGCAAALFALRCDAGEAVRVLDVDGQGVVLARPARRVVSLAPHLTELMFAIGAGDRVVGTVEYADYPEAAKRVPRVGDSALLDLERVVALQPDLLLVWRHGNSPQQLQRLAALNIPTYASEARTLADISRTLRDLGTLTGAQEHAQQRAHAFDGAVSDLRTRYAGRR